MRWLDHSSAIAGMKHYARSTPVRRLNDFNDDAFNLKWCQEKYDGLLWAQLSVHAQFQSPYTWLESHLYTYFKVVVIFLPRSLIPLFVFFCSCIFLSFSVISYSWMLGFLYKSPINFPCFQGDSEVQQIRKSALEPDNSRATLECFELKISAVKARLIVAVHPLTETFIILCREILTVSEIKAHATQNMWK